MTPKEKADELLKKFEQYASKPKGRAAGDFGDFKQDYELSMIATKRCAITCIYEMISEIKSLRKPEYTTFITDGEQGLSMDGYERLDYWQSVKEAIEKS